jgi:hypothetical protein
MLKEPLECKIQVCDRMNGTIRRKKTFRQRNDKSAHSRTLNTEGSVGFEKVRYPMFWKQHR